MMRLAYFSTLVLPLLIAPVFVQAASVVAYVEAPSFQSSSVSGVTTETFNSATAGTHITNYASTLGTYQATTSSKFAIVNVNNYGGAGGNGKYFAMGAESSSTVPVTLSLSSEANYFGFWWSAGDVNNSITLLQNNTALATFTTANIVALLPNTISGTVTAINGVVYNTKNYYGNPNNVAQDPAEPFAYVDIIANGLQFNQIQFGNSTTASGFESDNHSVASGVTDPPVGDVIVQNVPLSSTPEPETWVLLLTGVGLIGLVRYARLAYPRR